MGYKLNGSTLTVGVAFKDSNGASYPANWLKLSNQTDRDAVPTGGIKWEAEPASYDERFYWGPGKPKDIAGLKTEWIRRQKKTASTLLTPTDWLIIRKAEAGTAVSSDTTTYRAAVRTKSKEREDQITACSDTDALAILLTLPSKRPEKGTADNGATEKKKEDDSSYDPKQYEQVQNPSGLKAWPKELEEGNYS